MMGVLTPRIGKTSTCLTLSSRALTWPLFGRLDELGLKLSGQRLEPDRAVSACRVVEPDHWCRRCACEGVPRETVWSVGWPMSRWAGVPRRWRSPCAVTGAPVADM